MKSMFNNFFGIFDKCGRYQNIYDKTECGWDTCKRFISHIFEMLTLIVDALVVAKLIGAYHGSWNFVYWFIFAYMIYHFGTSAINNAVNNKREQAKRVYWDEKAKEEIRKLEEYDAELN